jgi:transaldolase
MGHTNYLEWLSAETPTAWWHDSADPRELALARTWRATGVTTNPVLTAAAVRAEESSWRNALSEIDQPLTAAQRAEFLVSAVVKNAASLFEPLHRETGGRQGHVCAQVNPALCSQREAMLTAAMRFSSWAPNISVKLPATAAGLYVLEECAAKGICVTSTVSFTVAQAVAAAEAYRRGRRRAESAGIDPAPCFAVIMIGRVDDYLREVVSDNHLDVGEHDINLAGLAIVKRAYELFRQRKYEAQLLIAALRGVHHMEGLCGAELVMSIHPSIQKMLLASGVPRTLGIDAPIPDDSVKRLQAIPDFRKAFEADGLSVEQFISFGLTQKTLSQFSAGGWALLETFR